MFDPDLSGDALLRGQAIALLKIHGGDIEKAVEPFRQAVGKNPNLISALCRHYLRGSSRPFDTQPVDAAPVTNPSPVSSGNGYIGVDAQEPRAKPAATPSNVTPITSKVTTNTAKPPTPVVPPKKHHKGGKPQVSKSLLSGYFTKSTGDGRFWGEVWSDEIGGMDYRGKVAAVLKARMPQLPPGVRMQLKDIFTPAEFEEIYKEAMKVAA